MVAGRARLDLLPPPPQMDADRGGEADALELLHHREDGARDHVFDEAHRLHGAFVDGQLHRYLVALAEHALLDQVREAVRLAGAEARERALHVLGRHHREQVVVGRGRRAVRGDDRHRGVAGVLEALGEQQIDARVHRGDDVAQAVAGTLSLDFVFSQVLPADKDAYVSQLQENGDHVGMVGDGVNDAPALVRADIGIAIGSGTDVAVQAADLVLVKSDPRDVVKIIKLSAASMRKQLQNIWWGAGYNIVMVPLAAGILVPWGFDMPPAVGAVFMSLSTIIVAINAQSLRRLKLD